MRRESKRNTHRETMSKYKCMYFYITAFCMHVQQISIHCTLLLVSVNLWQNKKQCKLIGLRALFIRLPEIYSVLEIITGCVTSQLYCIDIETCCQHRVKNVYLSAPILQSIPPPPCSTSHSHSSPFLFTLFISSNLSLLILSTSLSL